MLKVSHALILSMQERSKKQKELSLEMRKMMSALFGNLESEFLAFMSHYEKVDSQ